MFKQHVNTPRYSKDAATKSYVDTVFSRVKAGASSSVFDYRVDTTTTSAGDPGAGKFRYSDAGQKGAVRYLYMDWITQDGFDVVALFTAMKFNDTFIIQDKDMSLQFQKWRLLGPAVNMPDYFVIEVEFLEGDAVFTNNQLVSFVVMFMGQEGEVGDQGEQGPPGPQGAQGEPGVDGIDGANGVGVPTGGTANQVLTKIDNTNYNTEWRVASGGNYLPLTGGALSGGLSFGNATAPGEVPTDLSRHIALWGSAYGFSVTGGTLNLVSVNAAILQLGGTTARVNGQITAYNGPGSSINTAAIRVSGSWGGGYALLDGPNSALIHAEAANLILSTGPGEPTRRLSINNDNQHILTGRLNLGQIRTTTSGEVIRHRVSNYSVIQYFDDANFHFLITNAGDADGGWKGVYPFRFNTDGYVTMSHGATVSGTLATNTVDCGGNIWAKGGVLYVSSGGHYINWQDGWYYNHPHGPCMIQGTWAAREGVGVTFSDCYTSSNHHSNGNHYFMAGDGVWMRWRGDLGRIDFSHGLQLGYVEGSHMHLYAWLNVDSFTMRSNSISLGDTCSFGDSSLGAWNHPRIHQTTNGVNGSWTSNYMVQSMSARRYKKDIKSLEAKDASIVLKLRPISFKANTELCRLDDPDDVHLGFIAEEVAEIEPRLVQFEFDRADRISLPRDGQPLPQYREGAKRQPANVEYDRISVLLVMLAKQHEERIKQLEGRINGDTSL